MSERPIMTDKQRHELVSLIKDFDVHDLANDRAKDVWDWCWDNQPKAEESIVEQVAIKAIELNQAMLQTLRENNERHAVLVSKMLDDRNFDPNRTGK